MTSFVFNLEGVAHARQQNELRMEALRDRLKTLGDKSAIDNQNILGWILKTCQDAEALKRLAKCLDRAADILPELISLERRDFVLTIAEEDQIWMASAFGDFTGELEAALDAIPEDNDIITFLEGLE
jgi:hypothetical protein